MSKKLAVHGDWERGYVQIQLAVFAVDLPIIMHTCTHNFKLYIAAIYRAIMFSLKALSQEYGKEAILCYKLEYMQEWSPLNAAVIDFLES